MNENASQPGLNSAALPFRSMAVLSLAMLATWGICAVVAGSWHGSTGVIAASVAAVICLASGIAALLVTALVPQQQAVSSVMLSTLIRTGAPLLTAAVVTTMGGPLRGAGFFGLVLIHYSIGLMVETPLAVRIVRKRTESTGTI